MTGRRKGPASSIRRYRCGPVPPDASRSRVIAQKVLLLCIPDNAVDEGDIEIAENRKRLIGDGGRDLLLRHHNQDTGILGDAPPLKPTPFKGKRRFFAAAQAPIGEPALLRLGYWRPEYRYSSRAHPDRRRCHPHSALCTGYRPPDRCGNTPSPWEIFHPGAKHRSPHPEPQREIRHPPDRRSTGTTIPGA